MENLPQNENNIKEEGFSTIFSNPIEHKEKVKKGNSHRFLRALSLFLIVAIIIGGIFAVIKLIPEKEEDLTSSDNKIKVLDYYDYDIKEITVKNKNGSFNIYSKVVEAKDETTEEVLTETYWYLKGYDSDLTDSSALQDVVDTAVDFDAIRTITSKSEKECGFDNPVVTINIISNEGEKYTVKIGDKSPDNSGIYVKTSISEDIYLVGVMLDEKLTFTALDFASTEAQAALTLDDKYDDYLSGDTIISFDSITVSGKNLSEDVVLTPNTDKELSGFVPYYLTKPMYRAAQNGDTILSLFSQGFPVSGAYSYNADKSTLNNLGLNKPDFQVSAKFGDYTYTYKFKQQDDGDYAFVGNDSKNVKKVSADDCGFLDYTIYDFYSRIVFITPIDSLSNLKIETADGSYDFKIKASDNSDDENETTKKYIVECDGKIYNSTYFQSYYQFLSGLESMNFEVEKTTQKPSLTITYTYNDKSKKSSVIEYVKINATQYQYYVDGVAMGRIGSTSYNKIEKNLERLLAGKQIVVN